MKEVPTVKNFFKKNEDSFEYLKESMKDEDTGDDLYNFYAGVIQNFALEFAKLHLEAQKEAILKNIKLCIDKGEGFDGKEEFEFVDSYQTEEGYSIYPEPDTIKNAYNINNIK